MSDVAKQLGYTIRRLRLEMSPQTRQKDLAERANITPAYLSMIEGGRRIPPIETLVAIARSLDVPLSSLFSDLSVRPEPAACPAPSAAQNPRLELIRMLSSEVLEDSDAEALLRGAKMLAAVKVLRAITSDQKTRKEIEETQTKLRRHFASFAATP